jgi:hypothetical protein
MRAGPSRTHARATRAWPGRGSRAPPDLAADSDGDGNVEDARGRRVRSCDRRAGRGRPSREHREHRNPRRDEAARRHANPESGRVLIAAARARHRDRSRRVRRVALRGRGGAGSGSPVLRSMIVRAVLRGRMGGRMGGRSRRGGGGCGRRGRLDERLRARRDPQCQLAEHDRCGDEASKRGHGGVRGADDSRLPARQPGTRPIRPIRRPAGRRVTVCRAEGAAEPS